MQWFQLLWLWTIHSFSALHWLLWLLSRKRCFFLIFSVNCAETMVCSLCSLGVWNVRLVQFIWDLICPFMGSLLCIDHYIIFINVPNKTLDRAFLYCTLTYFFRLNHRRRIVEPQVITLSHTKDRAVGSRKPKNLSCVKISKKFIDKTFLNLNCKKRSSVQTYSVWNRSTNYLGWVEFGFLKNPITAVRLHVFLVMVNSIEQKL